MASAVQTATERELPAGSGRPRTDVAVALRALATRLASATEGAVLVFAREASGGELRLRTAAGVASPEAARAAAEAIAEAVNAAALQGAASRIASPAPLGPRGAGGLSLCPLASDGVVLGVLAAATPAPPAGAVAHAIEMAGEALAARIAHAGCSDELLARAAEEKSDEVLKLSEVLFAQDIEILRSNERLGQVEKLKNDFIEKMSRELRTPLNSIIESIIAVLAGENDVLSETAQQCLRRALDDGT